VLTPDSSRFWPKESFEVGRGQPSLDKQPVRDYLEQVVNAGEWNKEPPPPDLPDEVVNTTSDRYLGVFRRLTGVALDDFPAHDAPGGGGPPR
jgi:phosphoribosylaminoimidazole-succinocarboxamide synthase